MKKLQFIKNKSLIYNHAQISDETGIVVASQNMNLVRWQSILMIDESTPDSSRFGLWRSINSNTLKATTTVPARLSNNTGWKQPPATALPDELIAKNPDKYMQSMKLSPEGNLDRKLSARG
jgi:phosphoribosylaminoimidazole-succinocarboxamide synthase